MVAPGTVAPSVSASTGRHPRSRGDRCHFQKASARNVRSRLHLPTKPRPIRKAGSYLTYTVHDYLSQMRMLFLSRFRFHRRQPFQDAAGVHRLLVLAALTQFAKLLLELGQFRDSCIDVGDMLVQ